MSQTNQPDPASRGQWVCGACLTKWSKEFSYMTLGQIADVTCFVCGKVCAVEQNKASYVFTAQATEMKAALAPDPQ